MRMRKWMAVIPILTVLAVALTGAGSVFEKNVTESLGSGKTVPVAGTLSVTGTLGASGTFTNSATETVSGVQIATPTAVSLTSPTLTFDVSETSFVSLQTDANQTGVYPTGGALHQVVTIQSGAGSNTARFDDGTSMTIGANFTLTEGQGDFITLKCVSADGDEWTEVSSADN